MAKKKSDQETEQAALPSLGLPEFEGITPVAVETTLTGSGQRIHRPIHHGERLILVIEAEATDIRHPRTKQGVKRKQILFAEDMYELDSKRGKELLGSLRTAYRLAEDERGGRKMIDGWKEPGEAPEGGVNVTVDGSGTALLPSEVADARGLPPGLIVIFTDGARALWPDDFPDGEAKPKAGAEMNMPKKPRQRKTVVGIVREILDAETGETIEATESLDGDLDAISELERGRGNCGEIYAAGEDSFAVCTREAGHKGEHL